MVDLKKNLLETLKQSIFRVKKVLCFHTVMYDLGNTANLSDAKIDYAKSYIYFRDEHAKYRIRSVFVVGKRNLHENVSLNNEIYKYAGNKQTLYYHNGQKDKQLSLTFKEDLSSCFDELNGCCDKLIGHSLHAFFAEVNQDINKNRCKSVQQISLNRTNTVYNILRAFFIKNLSLHYYSLFNPTINVGKMQIGDASICIFCEEQLTEAEYNLIRASFVPWSAACSTQALLKRVTSESLKSAVAAIMTRNMSHNLGSHYLHYTKMQLDQLAQNTRKFGPDIRGAAKVMGYMQGRMDFLATLISGDRYPYGCVNFKSQIYDELTIDDFSKRHFKKKDAGHRTTNFLLTNLIWSEGFTRSNIIDGTDAENSVNIHIRYNNCIFTGSAQRKIANRENHVKQKLSEINIAMPGGVMSCHAFFNVVENFIRNSAKYHQQDFQNIKNLTTTIKISETKENNFDVYEFVIYDNKQNAYSKEHFNNEESDLITSIKNRLSSLRILDDNNAVEKSNKGFKEMLFSTIWMRSFVFMQKDGDGVLNSFSDVLATIQSTPDGDEKLKLIEKYGFSIIAVNDEGEKCSEANETANLALRFTLPKFKKQFEVSLFSNEEYDAKLAISRLLNVYGEVVRVNQASFDQFIEELNKKANNASSIDKGLVIPRMVTTDQKFESDVEALKYVLYKRFGQDFDMYKISIENIKENRQKVEEPYKIYFQTHLSTKADINDFKDHAYADSISGGNFTLTLSEIFNRWKEKDWDKNAPEYYEVLKIKESALTRITLIDERLYNEMLNKDNGVELACKNIRVLNYSEPSIDDICEKFANSLMKLFKGNEFNSGENSTHFLSIHLGIIEKIIKNSNVFNSMKDEFGKEYGEYPEQERTIMFMNLLKKHFGNNKQEVFISIHSGRGNYSAELNGPLSIYPFISMSAIENAYNNSKYLLSQLFYSTIYLGKGIFNYSNEYYENNLCHYN